MRELLIEWFATMRHSFNHRVQPRFPKKVLVVKAEQLLSSYNTECLRNGVKPNGPKQITYRWVDRLLSEHRLSVKKPNRKFKVPLKVLQERLLIFWVNVARIRQFILCAFGHEPEFENMDQTPYHMNEAGLQTKAQLIIK